MQFKLHSLTIEVKGEKIRRKKAGGCRVVKEGIGEESPLVAISVMCRPVSDDFPFCLFSF